MEDNAIIQLYWARDEGAIAASEKKYGGYCGTIARNIVGDRQTAEECVNDTWLRAWDTMPPQKPSKLAVFLGRITRNLSFDRYRQSHADRRGNGVFGEVLDELAECVSGNEGPETEWERRELAEAIDGFLRQLPKDRRRLFVRRYWYGERVSDIAAECGMTSSAVSTALGRMRESLRRYLSERGFAL